MLSALSLGNIYKTEGSYLTLTILNFVIAIGLLFTPVLVKSLLGEGIQSTASTVGPIAAAAMVALPTRLITVKNVSREFLSNSAKYVGSKFR